MRVPVAVVSAVLGTLGLAQSSPEQVRWRRPPYPPKGQGGLLAAGVGESDIGQAKCVVESCITSKLCTRMYQLANARQCNVPNRPE